MNLKTRVLKRLIGPLAFTGIDKIVVASSGRAGSTMLYDAIADSLVWHRFRLSQDGRIGRNLKRYSIGHVYQLQQLPRVPYVVCKTHDVWENAPRGRFRYVFVYSDPLEAALSVERMVEREGRAWFGEHQRHLRATGAYEDLYQRDVLNFEVQLKGWLGAKRQDTLCIDYEDLWDKQGQLSDFVGFPVNLPERRRREVKSEPREINGELFERLRCLKDELKEQYESSGGR